MADGAMVTQAPLDCDAELNALESCVSQALEQARANGASAAEASAHTSQGLSVTVRLGQVETLEHMQDRGVSVTVYDGERKGSASSADLRPESIEACVTHALSIARYTQPDRCNGLADPERLATEFPDLDLWHPRTMDATAAIERAKDCEDAGRRDEQITNSEGGSFNAGLGLAVYGNSNGFVGHSRGTRYSQSCVLLAGEGASMQRDYAYDSRRSLEDLEPASETGEEAARRTLSRLNARRLDTSEMPVLLSAEVAKGFLGHLIGAVSGSTLYRNASFLKDAAGQQLFPRDLQLVEYPHLLRGSGSASFDNEGVATRERALVEDGVLEGYVLSTYSGRRLGLPTTGNAGGVRNLRLQAKELLIDDPLATLHDGFYVTEVMGQGVSLVTGDYSRGAAGFRVRNGQIEHAVEEVTIAGNLRDMFADITAVGSDLDSRGNIHCGSVLIGKMMVAGS